MAARGGDEDFRDCFLATEVVSDCVDFVEDAKEIVESMPSKSALMKMTKPELVEFAQGHGVDVAGTKSAIVERLLQLSK